MRLMLIAVAMCLAWMAAITSAEARPHHGHKGDRYERTHKHSTSKRHYSARYASRSRSAHRKYSHRRSGYAHNSRSRRHYARSGGDRRNYTQRRASTGRQYASAGRTVGGKPRAWCGWWMRTQLGGGPEYNVAANWKRYGRPSGPHVGAVVVWPHHVGMITGRAANGQWIVKSGNDGNAVRERARSVAGAVFRAG